MIHAGTFWRVGAGVPTPVGGNQFAFSVNRHHRRAVIYAAWLLAWLGITGRTI